MNAAAWILLGDLIAAVSLGWIFGGVGTALLIGGVLVVIIPLGLMVGGGIAGAAMAGMLKPLYRP